MKKYNWSSKNGWQKHGLSETRTYSVWESLKTRIYNKNSQFYHLYGGRGIKMQDSWNDFMNFYNDMGEVPTRLTLERIDTNGDYTKENCRWATVKEQQNNRRNNRRIEYQGQNLTLMQWTEKMKMKRGCLGKRLKMGWNIEEALTKPVGKFTKILVSFALIFIISPTFASAFFEKNLKYGDRGEQISELQELLISEGFMTHSATGNFYSLTLKAVKAFQTAHNLPSTGFFGIMSRAVANSLITQDEEIFGGIEATSTPVIPIAEQKTKELEVKIDTLTQQVQTIIQPINKPTVIVQPNTLKIDASCKEIKDVSDYEEYTQVCQLKVSYKTPSGDVIWDKPLVISTESEGTFADQKAGVKVKSITVKSKPIVQPEFFTNDNKPAFKVEVEGLTETFEVK